MSDRINLNDLRICASARASGKMCMIKESIKMTEYILARKNGRNIPQEDKIFGISNRAKAMIQEKGADKVINATIGSLLDDNGELVVLSSVDRVFKHLSPKDYADYAYRRNSCFQRGCSAGCVRISSSERVHTGCGDSRWNRIAEECDRELLGRR